MKLLVISDIHSNLEALEAVFENAPPHDGILCLGDIIGYGANPRECIRLVREKKAICLKGNHEAACTGELPLDWFNPPAREALEWTKRELGAKDIAWCKRLPLFHSTKDYYAVHGGPPDSIEDYVGMDYSPSDALATVQQKLLLVGHTHAAQIYCPNEYNPRLRQQFFSSKEIPFAKNRFFINAPSAGQPRDGDLRAGFLAIDFLEKTFRMQRVEYDRVKAAEKILGAGLPHIEAARLLSEKEWKTLSASFGNGY
jgi:predicted phosphodiesterase